MRASAKSSANQVLPQVRAMQNLTPPRPVRLRQQATPGAQGEGPVLMLQWVLWLTQRPLATAQRAAAGQRRAARPPAVARAIPGAMAAQRRRRAMQRWVGKRLRPGLRGGRALSWPRCWRTSSCRHDDGQPEAIDRITDRLRCSLHQLHLTVFIHTQRIRIRCMMAASVMHAL